MNATIRNDYYTRKVLEMGYEMYIEREDDVVTVTIGDEEWHMRYVISRACYDGEVDYQVYTSNGYNNRSFNITNEMPSLEAFGEYANDAEIVFNSYIINCIRLFVGHVKTFKF